MEFFYITLFGEMICYTDPFKIRLFRAEEQVRELMDRVLELEEQLEKHPSQSTAGQHTDGLSSSMIKDGFSIKKKRMYSIFPERMLPNS